MSNGDTTLGGTNDGTDADDGGSWAVTVLFSPDRVLVNRVFFVDSSLTFGRTSADVVIDDALMSRKHATISRSWAEASVSIVDHDSRNGVRLNGERVREALLWPGALIRLGNTLLGLTLMRSTPVTDPVMVGQSPAWSAVVEQVQRVSQTELAVLLLGETGTGKEVVARRIHQLSGRPEPFVAVNCASLPTQLAESMLFGHVRGAFTGAQSDRQGCFASAGRGTLFLDEIGALPLEQQPKLLRVLETGEFMRVGDSQMSRTHARLVSATNVDLARAAKRGTFRLDLYARLSGLIVRLPPLRQRRSDILLLARHFMDTLLPDLELEFTASFAEALLRHGWEMNIREMRNMVQRIPVVVPAHESRLESRYIEALLALDRNAMAEPTPTAEYTPPRSLPARGARPTRVALEKALEKHRGNVSQVARSFGQSPQHVYRWMGHYGLQPDSYRVGSRVPERAELEARMRELAGNIRAVARHYGKDPRQIRRWLDRYQLKADAFRDPDVD